eukprot:PhM_4_TR11224/c0_g1_i1/m.18384/K04954/HCN1; hyperpolarization activated cyclic nucleotide-gated potassium channel 1
MDEDGDHPTQNVRQHHRKASIAPSQKHQQHHYQKRKGQRLDLTGNDPTMGALASASNGGSGGDFSYPFRRQRSSVQGADEQHPQRSNSISNNFYGINNDSANTSSSGFHANLSNSTCCCQELNSAMLQELISAVGRLEKQLTEVDARVKAQGEELKKRDDKFSASSYHHQMMAPATMMSPRAQQQAGRIRFEIDKGKDKELELFTPKTSPQQSPSNGSCMGMIKEAKHLSSPVVVPESPPHPLQPPVEPEPSSMQDRPTAQEQQPAQHDPSTSLFTLLQQQPQSVNTNNTNNMSVRNPHHVAIAPLSENNKPMTLLPESWYVTAFELIFCLICIFESAFVFTAVGSYNWEERPSTASVFILILAVVVNIGFVFLRTRVAITHNALLVDSPNAVRSLYTASNWFKWDIAMSVPVDLVLLALGQALAFRVLCVLRVMRAVRIPTLFQGSNPLVPQRVVRSLVRIGACVVYGHMIASMCWMLVHLHPDRPTPPDGLANDSFYAFITGVYWAIQLSTSVGLGDIVMPTDTSLASRATTSVFMLLGVGAYGYVISYMSARLIHRNRVQETIREKQEKMNAMMEFYQVPWDVQKQMFALYPRLIDARQSDFQDVMQVLPPFVQEHIAYYIRRRLLMQVPMFKDAPEELIAEFTHALVEELVPAGESVVSQGEIGSEMFFVVHGIVEVTGVNEETGEEVQLALLQEGAWFGEIGILKEVPRTASVHTVTSCDLMVLSKQRFHEILDRHRDHPFVKAIEDELSRRLEEFESAVKGFLGVSMAVLSHGSANHQNNIGNLDFGQSVLGGGANLPMESLFSMSRISGGTTTSSSRGAASVRLPQPQQQQQHPHTATSFLQQV